MAEIYRDFDGDMVGKGPSDNTAHICLRMSGVLVTSCCSDISVPSTDASDEHLQIYPGFHSAQGTLYKELSCEDRQRIAALNLALEDVSSLLDVEIEPFCLRESRVRAKCNTVIFSPEQSTLRVRRLSGSITKATSD